MYPPWRLSVQIRLALQPQAAVEPDHQVIVAIDMSNQPSDVVQLLSMLKAWQRSATSNSLLASHMA